ncbi:hypothetical protein M942_08475 [Enterobacter ludwigii]|uniref:ECs1072 family phage-associated protein n=1 Tax=Enterobacter ludwigii TaxID=299767 RepID=UPI0003D89B9C|nr:hypothetical protein M942_08475 [Enterobacter ludwigii]
MEVHKLRSLFTQHAKNIAMHRKWSSEGELIPTLKAWLRAEQLLRLDMLIMQYRDSHPSAWAPMRGTNALNQLVFSRTGWTLAQINQLSFDEKLLVLHQDLAEVNIQQEVLDLPETLMASLEYAKFEQEIYRIEWPPCSEKEWDPNLSEIAQGLRKPF